MKKVKLQPARLIDSWELDVPGDNSCLFWSIALAFLLPVLSTQDDFNNRFRKLFGNDTDQDYVKNLLSNYNPFSNTLLFGEKKLNLLIREVFRSRVINYMADNINIFKEFFESTDECDRYLLNMQNTAAWGGELEIRAASILLGCNIIVYERATKHTYPSPINDADPLITIRHVNFLGNESDNKNHYHFDVTLQAGDQYVEDLQLTKNNDDGINLGKNKDSKLNSQGRGRVKKKKKKKKKLISVNSSSQFLDVGFDPFKKDENIKMVSWEECSDQFRAFRERNPDITIEIHEAIMLLWLAFKHGYRNEIAMFDLFIRPAIKSEKCDDLIMQIQGDISKTSLRSFLVESDAGMGKTFFCQFFCNEWWNLFIEGQQNRIPIYIHLPQIPKKNRKKSLLNSIFKQLNKMLDKTILKDKKLKKDMISIIRKMPLLLILDGFDEISERINLFESNKLGDLQENLDIKVLYACRPEALDFNSGESLFGVSSGNNMPVYKQYNLLTLNTDQITFYLERYKLHHQLRTSVEYYDYWLKNLPGLYEIVETPILLKLVVDIIPIIVEKYKTKEPDNLIVSVNYSRWYIYQTFLWEWIKSEAARLREKLHDNIKHLQIMGNLEECIFSYMSNLANHLWSKNVGHIENVSLLVNDTLKVDHLEPRLRVFIGMSDEEKERARMDLEERLVLFNNGSNNLAHVSGRTFFEGKIVWNIKTNLWEKIDDKDIQLQESQKRLKLIRATALLRTHGQNYQFVHRTIVEFLTIEGITFDLRNQFQYFCQSVGEVEEQLQKFQININNIRNQPNMIRLFVQQFREDEYFIALLGEIILTSKTMPDLSIAAANAMTLLNAMGISFSNIDLRDIQVPGADLRESVCDSTDFRGANLGNVWAHRSWLRNARFDGANIEQIEFGAFAPLEHKYRIGGLATYQKQGSEGQELSYWVAGSDDGYVYQWSIDDNQLIDKYKHGSRGLNQPVYIDHVAVHSPSHLLVSYSSTQDEIVIQSLLDRSNNRVRIKVGYQLGDYPYNFDESLVTNGKFVVCNTMSGPGLKLYSAQTGLLVRTMSIVSGKDGGKEKPDCLSFSPDGTKLASGGWNINIWDIESDRETPDRVYEKIGVRCICFSPNNILVAAGGIGREIAVWDIVNNLKLWDLIPYDLEDWQSTKSIIFNPNGKFLISSVFEQPLRLWSLEHGSCLRKIEIFALNFILSPDFKVLASHKDDYSLKFQSLDTEAITRTTEKSLRRIACIELSSDCKRLVCGNFEQQFDIWSTKNAEKSTLGKWDHIRIVTIKISPDNTLLYLVLDSANYNCSFLQVWSLDKKILLKSILKTGRILFASIDTKCSLLAYIEEDHFGQDLYVIPLYKPSKATNSKAAFGRLHNLPLPGTNFGELNHIPFFTFLPKNTDIPYIKLQANMQEEKDYFTQLDHKKFFRILLNKATCMQFSPDGSVIAVGLMDGSILLAYVAGNEKELIGDKEPIINLCFSASGNQLITTSKDKTIKIWSLLTGEPQQIFSESQKSYIITMDLSYDGSILATGNVDQSLVLYSFFTGTVLQSIKFDSTVTHVKWGEAESILIVITVNNVLLFDCQVVGEDVELLLRWVRSQDLCMLDLNVTQSLNVPNDVRRLFESNSVIGKPALEGEYKPYYELFLPLSGTAQSGLQHSLIHIDGLQLTISSEIWVVSVADKKGKGISRALHTFLILEGVINYKRFIIRAELTTPGKKRVKIDIKTVGGNAFTLDNFRQDVIGFEAQQWQITKEEGLRLVSNIREDQRIAINYQMLGNLKLKKDKLGNEFQNCITWCKKQLELIGKHIPDRWYNFIVTLPNDIIHPPSQIEPEPIKPIRSNKGESAALLSQANFFSRNKKSSINRNIKRDKVTNSLLDHQRLVTKDQWCLSLVRNTTTREVFILIEGVIYDDCFLLITNTLFKNPIEDLTGGLFHRLSVSNYPGLLTDKNIAKTDISKILEGCEYQGWTVSQDQAEKILSKIVVAIKSKKSTYSGSSYDDNKSSVDMDGIYNLVLQESGLSLSNSWYSVKLIQELKFSK